MTALPFGASALSPPKPRDGSAIAVSRPGEPIVTATDLLDMLRADRAERALVAGKTDERLRAQEAQTAGLNAALMELHAGPSVADQVAERMQVFQSALGNLATTISRADVALAAQIAEHATSIARAAADIRKLQETPLLADAIQAALKPHIAAITALSDTVESLTARLPRTRAIAPGDPFDPPSLSIERDSNGRRVPAKPVS